MTAKKTFYVFSIYFFLNCIIAHYVYNYILGFGFVDILNDVISDILGAERRSHHARGRAVDTELGVAKDCLPSSRIKTVSIGYKSMN